MEIFHYFQHDTDICWLNELTVFLLSETEILLVGIGVQDAFRALDGVTVLREVKSAIVELVRVEGMWIEGAPLLPQLEREDRTTIRDDSFWEKEDKEKYQ